MAKAVYVGVGSKARKMKKAYIGIGGKARKVKKMYIGVGGKARLCYSAELEKVGMATALSTTRYDMRAATVGKYALFAGGYISKYSFSYSVSSSVDAYNTSLTKSTPTELSYKRCGHAAASVGGYALFAGGRRNNGLFTMSQSAVDAYNTSLTRTTATPLVDEIWACAGGSVGGYAVFGGGCDLNTDTSHIEPIGGTGVVQTYDSSLTSSKAAPLSCPRAVHSAATIGNHLLFAGGWNDTTGKYLSTVESYDASLTRSTAVELSSAKIDLASATVGEYAMFAGGYKGKSDAAYVATVDAYNTALTKTTMPDLSVGRHGLASAVIGDYALFAGGISKIQGPAYKYQDVVDVYSA